MKIVNGGWYGTGEFFLRVKSLLLFLLLPAQGEECLYRRYVSLAQQLRFHHPKEKGRKKVIRIDDLEENEKPVEAHW